MSSFRPFLIALALLAGLSLTSQTLLAEGQYDIEVIVFERYGQGEQENWPEEVGIPDLNKAVGDLSRPGLQGPLVTHLPVEERELSPAAYTLKKKGARVHAHSFWRQTVDTRGSAQWYRLGSDRLNGLLRLSRGRFLHVDTDFLLRTGDKTYRIQLHRRMRSGETHYVDHPKIGLLIRTERHQLASAAENPGANEPVVEEQPVQPDVQQEQPRPGSLPRAMPDPT